MTRALLDLGTAWGAGQMRRLRPALSSTYGAAGEFDDLQATVGVGGAVVAAVGGSRGT